MKQLLKLPFLAGRAFSTSARQLRNKVPEAQKLFQYGRMESEWAPLVA